MYLISRNVIGDGFAHTVEIQYKGPSTPCMDTCWCACVCCNST